MDLKSPGIPIEDRICTQNVAQKIFFFQYHTVDTLILRIFHLLTHYAVSH